MAKWGDLADWCGPTVNQGGKMVEQRGVVLHIAQGSYAGTVAWQKNPNAQVSSHFIAAKDGRACQMVDTDTTAWTQKAGNGHWLSIENEGSVPDKLTPEQMEFAAQVLARAHKEYGVPLQVATSPDSKGLGHHSMGADPGSPDDWGHSACPGTNIINQKPAIVARAKEIVEGELDAKETQQAVWTQDNAFLSKYFPWLGDSTAHDPPGTNVGYAATTVIIDVARKAYAASQDSAAALKLGKENAAALARIEAILSAGVPVPGEVNLTEESIGKVADAVATEEAQRLAE